MEDDGKMQEHVGSILDIMEEHGGNGGKPAKNVEIGLNSLQILEMVGLRYIRIQQVGMM